MMDWDGFARFALPLMNFALALYVYFSNRNTADAQVVQTLTGRVTTLEERVRNMPDHQLITQINGDMKAVRAELEGLRDVISPLSRQLDRINDYLLSHKP